MKTYVLTNPFTLTDPAIEKTINITYTEFTTEIKGTVSLLTLYINLTIIKLITTKQKQQKLK